MTYVVEYNKQERIRELEQKIFAVCVGCSHLKGMGGQLECDRKRSSKRVRKWLDEIKRLEEK